MKEKKKSLTITFTLLFIIVVIIGVAYAYFVLTRTQESTNIIGTLDCLNVTLDNSSSAINLTDAVPITDETGMRKEPYNLKITNNCDTYAKVNILVESIAPSSGNRLSDEYVKTNIKQKGKRDGETGLLSEKTLVNIETGRSGYKFKEIYIAPSPNGVEEYELRVWLDSETTLEEGMNKVWNGKVVLIVEAADQDLIPALYKGGEGTLLESIKNNSNISVPLSTPGVNTSLANEAVLASAEDDYGTSYYFRGNVKNNYVEFANKCWRIVRVDGNGNIKLVLHNDNTITMNESYQYVSSTVDKPCSVTNDDYASGAKYHDSWYDYTAFNSTADSNAYVGFMYGTPNSSTYAAEHENKNKSTILTNLTTWYNTLGDINTSKLADIDWCQDKSIVADKTYNPGGYATLGDGSGTSSSYYASMYRLVNAEWMGASSVGPTFKCDNSNGVNRINSANTGIKAALLTADEVAYAGYSYMGPLVENYLYENSAGGNFWTMTPAATSMVFTINNSGFNNTDPTNSGYQLRPAVALSSTTTVTGSGTSFDPYVVS